MLRQYVFIKRWWPCSLSVILIWSFLMVLFLILRFGMAKVVLHLPRILLVGLALLDHIKSFLAHSILFVENVVCFGVRFIFVWLISLDILVRVDSIHHHLLSFGIQDKCWHVPIDRFNVLLVFCFVTGILSLEYGVLIIRIHIVQGLILKSLSLVIAFDKILLNQNFLGEVFLVLNCLARRASIVHKHLFFLEHLKGLHVLLCSIDLVPVYFWKVNLGHLEIRVWMVPNDWLQSARVNSIILPDDTDVLFFAFVLWYDHIWWRVVLLITHEYVWDKRTLTRQESDRHLHSLAMPVLGIFPLKRLFLNLLLQLVEEAIFSSCTEIANG